MLVAAIACKSSDKSEPKPAEPSPKAATDDKAKAPATAPAPADDGSAEIAAKPREPLAIPSLGVTIDVPAGTTITPPSRPEDAKRNVNLKQGAFMVNVFVVDEYSAPSFAKAKEVHRDDKLVEWYRSEETKTGWVNFKQVVSGLHKGPRFEIGVRTQAGGKKVDCEVSAKSKALAEIALEACTTLR